MSNNKQIKTHITTATILIAMLLLCWAIAKIDAVFYSVLALSVLGTMYAFIYLTIIRNRGNNDSPK
jgi:predicted benzoate:H+ symporter BenE